MRILLALAIGIGGILALNAPADADTARKDKRAETKRVAKSQYKRPPPRYYYSREAVECERARHADPTGVYAGYPCWAQEALSPQSGNDRR